MRSRLKRYPINQSPLYKLRNRRKLASIFNLKISDLEALVKRNDNYRIFRIGKETKKTRTVEVPKPKLDRLHHRLFVLLSRIEPPDYLHSGVKGRSYVTNAKSHLHAHELAKVDIVQFFPSTKGWHVFNFFQRDGM